MIINDILEVAILLYQAPLDSMDMMDSLISFFILMEYHSIIVWEGGHWLTSAKFFSKLP